MKLYEYSNPNSLIKRLCKKVEGQLRTSIKNHNRAVLVLSGGHTPNLYLPKLFTSQLIWEKIYITYPIMLFQYYCFLHFSFHQMI